MRLLEHMTFMEEVCAADRFLMETLEPRRQLEKSWLKWVDNIKMDSPETGWGCGVG
jgi:hypothetical protein